MEGAAGEVGGGEGNVGKGLRGWEERRQGRERLTRSEVAEKSLDSDHLLGYFKYS